MKKNNIKVSKREMIEEHKELVPKLKRVGLQKEAEKQERELKSLKKR